jgi:serine/threonine protein kinase
MFSDQPMSDNNQIEQKTDGSLLGSVIDGRYRIEKYIGEGAMGAVFKAEQIKLRRTIAVKVPLAKVMRDSNYRVRLQREAHAMAKMHHENVVGIFDFNVATGPKMISYLALEYAKGTNLDIYLRREQSNLKVGEVIDLFEGIAKGLEAAHEIPIIHRDIKPSNIVITEDKRIPKILDFGIAKFEDTLFSTKNPEGMGTLVYMAPEQLVEGKKISPATDVYAFAMTIYRELARNFPFDGDQHITIALARLQTSPHPIHNRNTKIPQAVDVVLQQGLTKDPDERYHSACKLVADLREALYQHLDDPFESLLPSVDQAPPNVIAELSTEADTHIARFMMGEDSTFPEQPEAPPVAPTEFQEQVTAQLPSANKPDKQNESDSETDTLIAPVKSDEEPDDGDVNKQEAPSLFKKDTLPLNNDSKNTLTGEKAVEAESPENIAPNFPPSDKSLVHSVIQDVARLPLIFKVVILCLIIIFVSWLSLSFMQFITGSGSNDSRVIRTLEGHTEDVEAVAFSPDGSYILSGSRDKTFKLWNSGNGKEIRTFSGHSHSVSGVSILPKNEYALTSSWDSTLKLWNVADGSNVYTFNGHKDAITGVVLTPDGANAISAGGDNVLKLWDIHVRRELFTYEGHTDSVVGIAISPNGQRMLSASWDN